MAQIQKFAQKGLIFNKAKNAILVGRYLSSKYQHEKLTGKLFLPGGKAEFGEQPDTSFIAEVQEETGVLICPLQPVYIWTWVYRKKQDIVQIFAVARLAIFESGELLTKGSIENETEISEPFWLKFTDVKIEDFVFDEQPVVARVEEFRKLLDA